MLVCRWRCQPGLAQPPLWAPPAQEPAGPSLPLLRGWGPKLNRASLTPGPCPPAADALQTHSTVFQEHAAPSSPGAAPTTRGFRRASEISIASQVSGMAESYTASSIAQSECCGALLSYRGQCAPQGTAGSVWTQLGRGRYWHLVGRDQRCCSTPCSARDTPVESDPAPRVPRALWQEGIVEWVAHWGQVQEVRAWRHHPRKLGDDRPAGMPGS